MRKDILGATLRRRPVRGLRGGQGICARADFPSVAPTVAIYLIATIKGYYDLEKSEDSFSGLAAKSQLRGLVNRFETLDGGLPWLDR
jgi:hypothetical protein